LDRKLQVLRMLTKRQETAAAVAAELARVGGHVVSPMPLHDAHHLRFDVAHDLRDSIVQKVISWGWKLRPCGETERILPATNGQPMPIMVSVYEIALPREQSARAKDAIASGRRGLGGQRVP